MADQVLGSLPACRIAEHSMPNSWDCSEPLDGRLPCRRLEERPRNRFLEFLLTASPSDVRAVTHFTCLPYFRLLSVLAFPTAYNGLTGFTKPPQFACRAIIFLGLTAMNFRSSLRVRGERRLGGSDISVLEYEFQYVALRLQSPSVSCYRNKALPRRMMLLWHIGLHATP